MQSKSELPPCQGVKDNTTLWWGRHVLYCLTDDIGPSWCWAIKCGRGGIHSLIHSDLGGHDLHGPTMLYTCPSLLNRTA